MIEGMIIYTVGSIVLLPIAGKLMGGFKRVG